MEHTVDAEAEQCLIAATLMTVVCVSVCLLGTRVSPAKTQNRSRCRLGG